MKKKDLALFLGMMSGDGCLCISNSSRGYKDYVVEFYNTNISKMELFSDLFSKLFDSPGRINYPDREGRKRIYKFKKYSKEIFDKIAPLGIPVGLKKEKLRVPQMIKESSREEKIAFFEGFLITDGSIRKKGDILFHSSSKVFLEELSTLIKSLFGFDKKIKEYVQNEKYFSYQLHLNKVESEIILCHHGTMVLQPA